MSDDFPTLSEIGESNLRERAKRDADAQAAEEWMWYKIWKQNEYERL